MKMVLVRSIEHKAIDPEEAMLAVVDKAVNGLDAVNKVKKALNDGITYGLIIMDCSMPMMNGYDASDRIRNFLRKNNQKQPMIVACTGHVEEEYI